MWLHVEDCQIVVGVQVVRVVTNLLVETAFSFFNQCVVVTFFSPRQEDGP